MEKVKHKSSISIGDNRKKLMDALMDRNERMTRETMRTCPAYFYRRNNGHILSIERNHIGIFLNLFCSDLYKLRSYPTENSSPLYLIKNLDHPRFADSRSMQDLNVTLEDISNWFVENLFMKDSIEARSVAKIFYLSSLENAAKDIAMTLNDESATDKFYHDIYLNLRDGFAASSLYWR